MLNTLATATCRRLLVPFVTLGLLVFATSTAHAEWPVINGVDAKADASVSPVRVFKLSGPVHEANNQWDVFDFDRGINFTNLLQTIDREARNPAVKTLVFRIGGAGFGTAQLESLARALVDARTRGKKVIAHMESASSGQMLVASAADEVHVVPEGTLFLTGLRAEIAYYRDMMETLGLEMDMEAVGKFKSAAEPMTLRTMSEPSRKAFDAMLDSLYSSLLGGIQRHRKLSPGAINAIFDDGLLSAEDAKKRGLVDALSYWPELIAKLKKSTGAATRAFPAPREAPDLGSIFGVLELLTKTDKVTDSDRPRIALLTLEGPIVSGRRAPDMFGDSAVIASDDVVSAIADIDRDPQVVGMVVRVDSPGGSALASDVIWRALKQFGKKRPVVVSMGNTAASGGYYIASAGKEILAEEMTLTGSIGVFGGKLIYKGLMDKIGVNTVILSRGKNAGLFSPMGRFSDSERAVFRKNMEETYQTFVNKVARGRNMSYDAVHKVAQGRVWTGKEAVEVGLVDRIGGVEEAIASVAKRAKKKVSAVELVSYPKQRSFMDMFDSDPTRLVAPTLKLEQLARQLPGAVGERALGLVRLLTQLMAKELTLTMMPYTIIVR